MSSYSTYHVFAGLERVILLYGVLTIAFLAILSLQLYWTLKAQDSALARGARPDARSQALLIANRAVLWVFGYKGEHREKTPLRRVDLRWADRNRTSIIFRLIPVYGLYILTLVVLTRPIYFDGKGYVTFSYLPNLQELFILFVIYVSSNIFFDYLSLRFTFGCIRRALETKQYIVPFIKSASLATLLFFLSQIVSCILWVYKRHDSSFPKFDGGIFHNFTEIALWPYAFVTGPGSSQIISEPFPGQLLITGTVFIPTILLVALFLLFSAFLTLTEIIKRALLAYNLDRFCRLFVRARIIGVFEPPEKLASFGYCNLAFLALLELALVSGVGAVVSRLI